MFSTTRPAATSGAARAVPIVEIVVWCVDQYIHPERGEFEGVNGFVVETY